MTELEWIKIFQDNLRDILKDANMTQRELADAIGITEAAMSRIMNWDRMPSLKTIINISHELGISTDEIIYFDERIT